jgi:hypothetical protein
MVAVLGPFEALPYYIHTYIHTYIFRACMAYGFNPTAWRQVGVVSIISETVAAICTAVVVVRCNSRW